jgi:ATP-dependent Clp endopeptidase proteolytic subunit ClpP
MNTNKFLKKIANNQQSENKWFNISTENDVAQIDIIGEIGDMWDGVTADSFREELNKIDADEISIFIDSPGGLIFEGVAIYQALVDHRATITATVGSLAASISSVILMAADKIIMFENSEVMIHDPWDFAVGTAEDFRNKADFLDRLKSKIMGIYEARLGISRDQLSQMMKDETWIDGNQGVEMGFVDELIENKKAAACAFDLSMFNKVPERLEKRNKAMTKRELEKGLSDLGYSNKEAMEIVAGPKSQSDSEGTEDIHSQSDSEYGWEIISKVLNDQLKERD